MSDAAPWRASESTPSAAPPGLSGQTLPSGLVVLSRLCDSPEGRLYAALAHSGREVTLLVQSSEGPASSQDGSELVGRERQRAREERRQKVQAIHHPNIAEIYGPDVAADGTPCIVMEPFSGELLSGILTTRRAVPLSAAIDLALQAAAGLAAAHAAGVVHGHLSPETMLLTRTADGHRLKLIGFNLGLFVEGSRNGGGENARYASPEQLRGAAGDVQSDVYSLAAVLHHLVSGAPPTAGGMVAESIPNWLRAVLDKALAESRGDRYPTVAALVSALEHPSEPEDGPVEERGGRSRLVGLAAAIAVVAGVWLLWGWRRDGMRAEAEGTRSPTERTASAIMALELARSPTVASAPTTETTPPELAEIARATAESQQPRMSPFRRSHPWVAYPEGRFYYRSNCPETLEFDDLVYFASEKEAQAAGFLPAHGSQCP